MGVCFVLEAMFINHACCATYSWDVLTSCNYEHVSLKRVPYIGIQKCWRANKTDWLQNLKSSGPHFTLAGSHLPLGRYLHSITMATKMKVALVLLPPCGVYR